MPDLLEHPDLKATFAGLDDLAPLEPDLQELRPLPRPQPRLGTRRLALAAVALLALVVASEGVAIVTARMVVADAEPLGDPVTLTVGQVVTEVPWSTDRPDDQFMFWDPMFFALDGVLAASVPSGLYEFVGDEWTETARLSAEQVIPLASASDRTVRVLVARVSDDDGIRNEVWRSVDNGPWDRQPAPSDGLPSVYWADGRFWFIGTQPSAFSSPDGETWTEHRMPGLGVWGAKTAVGETAVVLGHTKTPEPLAVNPTYLWQQSGDGFEKVEVPGLARLGFGYLVGGFRLPDGIEDIVAGETGYLAYTGGLQYWGGFGEGALELEPDEAWSALVLTSDTGDDWDAHVVSGLALDDITPFGDGYLAWAYQRPTAPDETLIDELGREVTVPARPLVTLAYSNDGLAWSRVEGFETVDTGVEVTYVRQIVPVDGGAAVVVGTYEDDGVDWVPQPPTITFLEG